MRQKLTSPIPEQGMRSTKITSASQVEQIAAWLPQGWDTGTNDLKSEKT